MGPFIFSEGKKMTSALYIEFLTDHFHDKNKKNQKKTKSSVFCCKIILIHDNAPSHAAKNTSVGYWAGTPKKIYLGGKKFTSKKQLWKEGVSES